MNDQERQSYREKYQEQKSHGVPFFPDILFKDAVVSLMVFLVLIALAYLVGAPLEDRANPIDTTYTPRPEWYFLFLFQLLKYFPGNLEVVGVILLPTLAVAVLFLLPLLDRSAHRHPLARPLVTGGAAFAVFAVVGLTFLSIREAPPPAEKATGDPVAALYASNCAGCHGPSIQAPAATNLHEIIAQGRHEGMPAWSSDLTTDQIDALAGFILSPGGSQIFTEQCGACHQAPDLVAGDPAKLRAALEQGSDFPPHAGLDVPTWRETLQPGDRTALLNFLAAPDGQRLFATNCSACHGRSVAFSGDAAVLEDIIRKGGLHLEMPPWRERLTDEQIRTLAFYVVDQESAPEGAALFRQYCVSCHSGHMPTVATVPEAREFITGGGPHQTMPVWGDILTPQQLDALTQYTLQAAQGAPLEIGGQLFAENCSPCHGDFGEGGPNPTRPGDIIAPISSAEYLKTRDDTTLRSVIRQGQPNFGMSPFGNAFGGPLDDDEIDSIVAFLRTWETAPPVELPPESAAPQLAASGAEIYAGICAQCHGPNGQGDIGPSLRDPGFQASTSDESLHDTINLGHGTTAMIGWGDILTADQIRQLIAFIRQLGGAGPAPAGGLPSFQTQVLPLLQTKCGACHGTLGGWDASSYESVIRSGDHGPAVLPGDAQGSLLAQKLLGTQTVGGTMPPGGGLAQEEIRLILDWITGGALDN